MATDIIGCSCTYTDELYSLECTIGHFNWEYYGNESNIHVLQRFVGFKLQDKSRFPPVIQSMPKMLWIKLLMLITKHLVFIQKRGRLTNKKCQVIDFEKTTGLFSFEWQRQRKENLKHIVNHSNATQIRQLQLRSIKNKQKYPVTSTARGLT